MIHQGNPNVSPETVIERKNETAVRVVEVSDQTTVMLNVASPDKFDINGSPIYESPKLI